MIPILEARGVSKVYPGGDGSTVSVLSHLDLTVMPGEFLSVVGASGSGKSTLLHLLGGLDLPSDGEVLLEGQSLRTLGELELATIRNRRIGFVFQFHHLLRDFTALENVMMPMMIEGIAEDEAARRSTTVLGELGLGHRLTHYPSQLSGGEQQRTAVARAVVREPAVVLADEPSGNLDPSNAALLHHTLASLRSRFGTAVIVATHNYDLARRADRIVRLTSGLLAPAEAEHLEASP